MVAGGANQHLDELQKAVRERQAYLSLKTNVEDMPELMAWADVAIAAAGSTSWELAFMGVPFLAIALAENQRSIVISLDAKKVAVNCGDGNEITAEKLSEIILNVIYNREKRALMSLHSAQLND